MRRCLIATASIIVLSCSVTSGFSTDEALASFRGKFIESKGPTETDGKYLFVFVDAEVPSGVPGGANAVALTETQKVLLNWIDGISDDSTSPFCPLLSDFVLPDIPFKLPDVDMAVLQNDATGGRVRRVTAMEFSPLDAVRKEIACKKSASRTLQTWTEMLSASQANLTSDREHQLFLSLLGCPEMLIASIKGAKCFADNVDFGAVCNEIEAWDPDRYGPDDCRHLLSIVPSFAPAWKALAEMAERAEEWSEHIAYRLAANALGPDVLDLKSICSAAKGKGGSTAWDEYAELLPRLADSPLIPNGTNAMWKYVFRTAGHLDFNEKACDDNGAFAEAMALWKRGKNLPGIIDCLRISLETNPSNSKAWKYLGAALRTSGKNEQALIAYNEAVRLAPSDIEAAAYQAVLFQSLGYHAMASGRAWSVLLSSPNEKTCEIVRPILLANHPQFILQ